MMDESLFGGRQDEPELLGKVFDNRYEVESLIGRGGMGWVFKARHVTMQHEVALKVMRRELARELAAAKRFYQEARSSAQLKHPNTIRVYDFGASEDGLLYLAMEHLEGQPLSTVVQQEGPLDPARVIAIATQVCGSLDEAHDKGMVHRDLKPDNIFLTEVHRLRDFVKVLDFGIAKLVEADGSGAEALTSTGLVVGTPKYLSPEQAQARPVDRCSDLYSLGIILYELLVGRVPFDAGSAAALLVQHITVPAPDVPPAVDGVPIPPGLRALVGELLRKDPKDRPRSAAVVAERLAMLSGASGVLASATGALDDAPTRVIVERGDDGGATLLDTPSPRRVAPRAPWPHQTTPLEDTGVEDTLEREKTAKNGRRRVMLPLAVAGVLLVALAAWLVLRGPSASTTPDPVLPVPAKTAEPRPTEGSTRAAPRDEAADDRPSVEPRPAESPAAAATRVLVPEAPPVVAVEPPPVVEPQEQRAIAEPPSAAEAPPAVQTAPGIVEAPPAAPPAVEAKASTKKKKKVGAGKHVSKSTPDEAAKKSPEKPKSPPPKRTYDIEYDL